MFPIKAKEVLPVEKILVHSVAVRGQLGSMTVWVTNEDESRDANRQYNFPLNDQHWTKIYEKFHEPSHRNYVPLDLTDNPVVIRPGQVRAIYIHSSLSGDEAIVYDNSHAQSRTRFEDGLVTISSGKAHLSTEPFGQQPIWGWGNAWRDRREFVGQVEYGAVYKLWNPELHDRFGVGFREATESMLACQRRTESPIAILPDECIYYILNMCRWDWFGDQTTDLKTRRILRKRRARQQAAQARATRQRLANGESNDDPDPPAAAPAPEEEDDDSDREASEWERANGYRADSNFFPHQDISSDDDADDDALAEADDQRASWFRRSLARLQRVHVIRAIAMADREDVVEVNF
jgi:hypothetical protein